VFVSISAGANLALAKSGAGQQLDLINVMSYNAGNTHTDCYMYLCHCLQAPILRLQSLVLGSSWT
jgi:hypothetical protein